MVKAQNLFDLETKRQVNDDSYRIIHLLPEGKFYHAYEWSAWLCVRYVNEFKAIRKPVKNSNETLVYIGFPQTSLEKFTPEGSSVDYDENGNVTMKLAEDLVAQPDDITVLQSDFSNWKQSVPLKSVANDADANPTLKGVETSRPLHITDILRSVMTYPIEQKSPMECMAFLAKLKQQISAIL
ncbi:MAG: hypothetical protein Q4D14_08020 [Bacteroidales bacterium]|nr:hypothetical protein [Bacteroidales bacterium]